jgi:RNA polymerase sigma factor (sigma-70 family)
VAEERIRGLVLAAVSDEPGAWENLVRQFAGLIWSTARGLGLNAADAADVSQTTWLRLTEHLDDIRDPERIGGWLATTARNESLRILRLAQRQIPMDPTWGVPENDPARSTGVDSGLLANERDDQIRRAFESLPQMCRALLRVLMIDPTPTYAEVSAVLDIPIGSIGPQRSRCLQRLRSKSGVWDQSGSSVALGRGQ